MTATLPEPHKASASATTTQHSMVVIPRVHDGSGARARYGLERAHPEGSMLVFPQGPVADAAELRAGAALVLEREFGQGMSAAVTAPLGTVYADPSKQHRIEVMLAVARRTDAEYDQLPEPAAIPGVEWVEEDRLLPYLCSGRIADTTSAAAIAVLQACGELVR